MEKKLFRNGMTITILLLYAITSTGQDNIASQKNINPDFILTSRINSTGHFPYSGSLLNHHLNADINFYYKGKNLGFFCFKSFDLEDLSSYINYLQSGVFVEFPVGTKINLLPYAGFVLDQTKGFADESSDFFLSVVATYKEKKIKIENTVLLQNLFEFGSNRNLTNRLEVNLNFKNIAFSWFTWYKTPLFGIKEYVSTALHFKLPKVTITKRLQVESSIMFHSFITSYKPDYAMQRGVLFSIAFPLNLN